MSTKPNYVDVAYLTHTYVHMYNIRMYICMYVCNVCELST